MKIINIKKNLNKTIANIEEKFITSSYIIFGGKDGLVDIATNYDDNFIVNLKKEDANDLILDRDISLELIKNILNELNKYNPQYVDDILFKLLNTTDKNNVYNELINRNCEKSN